MYFHCIASVYPIIGDAQCDHQLQGVSANLSTIKISRTPYPPPQAWPVYIALDHRESGGVRRVI